jgi:putative MFS transporter
VETDAQRLMDDVASRLDRLPLSSFSYKLLIMMAPAWVIEAYDIGIIGPTIAVLKPLWNPSAGQIALLAIASTVAIAIGLIPSGMLVDKFGRRRVMLYGIAWFSVFTGLGGLSPNIEVLTAFRFLAGLGLGAVFPLPYVYISEFLAPAARAKFVGYLNGLLTADYMVPPLTAIYLTAHYPHEIAWRYLFLLAFVPLVYSFILWFVLPESPRWLASHGKSAEALTLLKRIEDETARSTKQPLPAPTPVAAGMMATSATTQRSDIFRPPFLRRTAVVWLAFFGSLPVFYVLVTYAPTLMVAQGFKLTNSLQFVALLQLAGGIGGVVQGFLGDRIGRRAAIAWYAAFGVAGLIALAYGNSVAVVLLAGIVVGFFGLGIYPVVKIYIAEQYPTVIRGFGTASAESFGRLFGGVAFVYAVPFIAAVGGTQLVTLIVALVLFLATLVPVAFFGRETKGRSIDVIDEGPAVIQRSAM